MAKKNKVALEKGAEVLTRQHGVGVVELIAQQDSDNGTYQVFHVRLANGDVRHFVAADLEIEE